MVIIYTTVFSVFIFILGIIISYLDTIKTCTDNNYICNLLDSLINMPSWIGTFISVLISTTLAFHYNIRKQKIDENIKKHEEDVRNTNELLSKINESLSVLTKIKSSYYPICKDNKHINRTLFYGYQITENFSEIKINPNSISFLMQKNGEKEPSNPLYIKSIIESTNMIIALHKERNILAKEFTDFVHNNMKIEKINIDEINKFGELKFKNYIYTTETLIKEIDNLIPKIYHAAIETPIIANSYFKKNNRKDYFLFYGLPSDKDLDMLLNNISIYDIDNLIENMFKIKQNSNYEEYKYNI
ncbi:hypothetical protein [Photobacterium leiognathi]|uniref:hypothetical protein n=1 Tax=Photobacterium leiognathi TaxID=553611 RepID=UPI00298193DA|nr:hypothetical protein [Photobacterium leiognathi]